MTDETTTEQLAEIDRDMADIERQVAELVEEAQQADYKTQELPEYTPPEGWQEVPLGEPLKGGDEYHAGLDRYIRRIKPEPQAEPEPEPHTAAIEELRSEVSYVQRLLGESNRKVAQLEELVGSLRTINEAQEKAFEAAGQHNSDLQSRLNGVCSEWVQQAETIRRLQIELDAAQQVPADSPELRQLRADLAEVAHDRDTYRHAHELLVQDVNATHARTKAMAVEAIAEWLQPIRAVDNEHLANETLQHLPQIMRHLTGLDSHAID